MNLEMVSDRREQSLEAILRFLDSMNRHNIYLSIGKVTHKKSKQQKLFSSKDAFHSLISLESQYL